jgi:hypothetical protein
MKAIKHVLILSIACLFHFTSKAQDDSCNLRITVLTCGPGDDLYSVFGHSAIRISDRTKHTDLIYNYGTFDFDDPDFYIKFVKGKLRYSLSVEPLNRFLYEYRVERRWVIEQQLSLTCEEKQRLNAALTDNAKDENRYYMYQFFFDNCSTRLRDIVSNNLKDTLSFKNILPHPVPTFRTLIHQYLDKGDQSWSEAGIDLLLGSLIDRKPTNKEIMFLPDYLMMGFDSAMEHNSSIVYSKATILRGNGDPLASAANVDAHARSAFNPVTFAYVLLAIGGIFSFVKGKGIRRFMNIFDTSLFFLLGAFGCLILFMWFGTAHDLCSKNYNLLWAIPTHLIACFFIPSQKSWIRKYFSVSMVFYLLVLLTWVFLPQEMHPSFLPLILLATIRSFKRSSFNRKYEPVRSA